MPSSLQLTVISNSIKTSFFIKRDGLEYGLLCERIFGISSNILFGSGYWLRETPIGKTIKANITDCMGLFYFGNLDIYSFR